MINSNYYMATIIYAVLFQYCCHIRIEIAQEFKGICESMGIDFQLKLLTALQVCDSTGIRMFTLFLIFLTYFHLTQTLLLHGNLISSLEVVKEEVARTVCTLSLADNDISDLNEVHCLEYMNIYMHTKN